MQFPRKVSFSSAFGKSLPIPDLQQRAGRAQPCWGHQCMLLTGTPRCFKAQKEYLPKGRG